MKDTEVEEIEITLNELMIRLLAKDLKKNIDSTPLAKRLQIPQFKFLVSILKKCEENRIPMLLCARECATVTGFIYASFLQTNNQLFYIMHDIIKSGLDKWEKTHPEKN